MHIDTIKKAKKKLSFNFVNYRLIVLRKMLTAAGGRQQKRVKRKRNDRGKNAFYLDSQTTNET